MSHENRLQQWLADGQIDIRLAQIGLIASVVLLGLRLLTTQVLILIIPTAVGVACVLYLGVQNRRPTEFEFGVLPRRALGYLPSIVFVSLAALVFLIRFEGRTVPVYLLIGAIGTIILVQILAVGNETLEPGLVLAQIIGAALVIRLTALFATPGFIGVDIWTHVPIFIDGIAESGSLEPIADSKYSMSPLYHTLGSVAALVLGSPRTGVYLSIGLLVPLSALFIFATGNQLLPTRWALFATALFVFADQVIRWGLHIIPTSLGLVFFLGALYALTTLFHSGDLRMVGFLFVFSLATVFTHQVSTAIMLTLLGAAAITVASTRVFGGRSEMNSGLRGGGVVGVFLTTLVVTVVSWMNTPWITDEPFLWQMVSILQGTLSGDAGFLNLAGGGGAGGGGGADGGNTSALAGAVPFIEWFGFAVLLSATIVGGLAMLRMGLPSEITLTYLLTGATMFLIVFGFSIFGVRTILPGRWIGFMYALFVIIGAIGLCYLSQNASRRVVIVVLLVVAVGYPATMVVSEKATLDSPAFEEEQPRFSYTETEIAAVETITTVYSPDDTRIVRTDHPYRTLFTRLGGYDGRTAEFDTTGATSTEPIVTREYQTRGPSSFREVGEFERSIPSRSIAPEQVCSPSRNLVYTNDVVEMCTTPDIETGGSA